MVEKNRAPASFFTDYGLLHHKKKNIFMTDVDKMVLSYAATKYNKAI